MKKFSILLLAMMMVFTLAACGGNDSPDPSGSGTGQQGEQTQGGTENSSDTAPDIDFGSIMAGNGGTDTVWGQQDAATGKRRNLCAKAGRHMDISGCRGRRSAARRQLAGQRIYQARAETGFHTDGRKC